MQVGPEPVFSILSAARLRGIEPLPIAVLVLVPSKDELHFRFRLDLSDKVDEEAIEVLQGWPDMIASLANDHGGVQVFRMFEDGLANYVRMTDPEPVTISGDDVKSALDMLFRKYIDGG